ncbi:hypothetical protein Scep_007549 [Stephania cephalantha]|uniref:Retrotransposon gag domain-containing protein n=1 Tax=Stephania cephalantha TaxID=152367 RepID=A0AAP0PLX1_9MAGN
MDERPILHANNEARRAVQYGGPPIQLNTESRVLGHNSRKYTPIEIQLRLRDELLTVRQGGLTVSQYIERFTYRLTFAMDVRRERATSCPLLIRGFRPEI